MIQLSSVQTDSFKNRWELLENCCHVLSQAGYTISEQLGTGSCFNLTARGGSNDLTFLIKVLINIDSLKDRHAKMLRLISMIISGSPMIIGERTRRDKIEDGVVHERHGIHAVNLQTLKEIVSGFLPLVYVSRGGYYVQISGEKLKEIREKRKLSLGQLAKEASISRGAIYEYERGKMDCTLETLIKLEKVLDSPLARPIPIFQFSKSEDLEMEEEKWHQSTSMSELEKSVRDYLIDLGFSVLWTKLVPFDAITAEKRKQEFTRKNIVITGLGSTKEKNIEYRIKMIRSLSDVIKKMSMFVLENKQINPDYLSRKLGVPIIRKDELNKFEDKADFIKTLTLREKMSH